MPAGDAGRASEVAASSAPDAESLCRELGAPTITWAQGPPAEDPALGDLGFGGCRPAGGGAWQVALRDVAVTAVDEEQRELGYTDSVTGVLTVRYVTLEGTSAEGYSVGFTDGGVMFESAALEVLRVYDFDGDGHAELLLAYHTRFHEGGDTSTMFLSYRDGSVVAYEPARDFAGAIAEVVDADGDTRPDVVSYAPYCRGGFHADDGGGGWTGGPRTLWHSVPDGSFSASDEVSSRYWREQCGPSTEQLVSLGDREGVVTYLGHETMLAIACARLRGLSVEAAREMIRRQWRSLRCADQEWCDDRLEASSRGWAAEDCVEREWCDRQLEVVLEFVETVGQ